MLYIGTTIVLTTPFETSRTTSKVKSFSYFFCTNISVVTKALDAETKTEAVYLKTEAEAQGSWPILLG